MKKIIYAGPNCIKLYHPLMKEIPIEIRVQAWSRIAVSKEFRFIYIRIPKAANSTITRTLAAHIFKSDREKILSERTGNLAKSMFDSLISTKCITNDAILKKYFIFSFFRNPYTRILSAYLDKLQSDFNYKKYQWVADDMGFKSTKEISFSEFISFLENGNLYKNPHWTPQNKLLPLSIENLHFVGKVESLESDIALIMNRFFKENKFGKIYERMHNKQYAAKKISLYYAKNIDQRVYSLFKEDFIKLKYVKELPTI